MLRRAGGGAGRRGQGIRTVAGGAEEAAIPVTAQVRHTTTIVLPREEVIADVVAGDADYWDVSAAENVAYVKPLETGVASNVTLVAESGRVWALLVAESSGEEPDLVVYVEGPERPSLVEAPRHAPAFVAGGELAAHLAEEAAARAELLAIEAAAAEEVSAIWSEHDAAWTRWRDEYPRRLRFPYRLDEAAFGPPFEVEALWHDGRFTYLRSRAEEESPALYELQEADRRFGREGLEPSLVSYEVFDDGLYVADHVLGPGRLRIGDSECQRSLRSAPSNRHREVLSIRGLRTDAERLSQRASPVSIWTPRRASDAPSGRRSAACLDVLVGHRRRIVRAARREESRPRCRKAESWTRCGTRSARSRVSSSPYSARSRLSTATSRQPRGAAGRKRPRRSAGGSAQ